MRAALGCALAACFVACAREPASSPARPVAFPPPPVLTSAPLAAPSALPSPPVAEPQATEGYAGAEDEPVDDGEPLDDVPPPLSAPPKPHPLEGWSEADIEKQLQPVFEKIRDEGAYDLILNNTPGVVVMAGPRVDITQNVIARLAGN